MFPKGNSWHWRRPLKGRKPQGQKPKILRIKINHFFQGVYTTSYSCSIFPIHLSYFQAFLGKFDLFNSVYWIKMISLWESFYLNFIHSFMNTELCQNNIIWPVSNITRLWKKKFSCRTMQRLILKKTLYSYTKSQFFCQLQWLKLLHISSSSPATVPGMLIVTN